MWHYNFDYLSHGTNGYKYIDKYRGKNGKWNYVYEGQNKRERAIKKSTIATRENIKNQLRGTPSYWDYLTTGRVPEGYKYNDNKKPAKKMNLTKQEIRQKVDPAIDQKAREREIAKGKAAAKDYRQAKVTAAEAQRERERAIKEGMSSNRQWDRNRVSKGSSVEAAQKARTKAIAEGRAANKDWYSNPTVKSKKSLIDYEKTGTELRNRVENLRDRVADKYNQASNSVNDAKDRFKEGHAQSEARKAEQRAANKAKTDKIKNKFKSDYDKVASSVKDTLNKMAEEAVKNQNENNRRQRPDDKAIKNFDRPTQITREVINRAKNEKGDVNRSIREAEIAKSVAKTQKVNEQLNREQWKSAANQQEAERRRSTAAIDAQNARQKAIEVSQARQRQAAAAKQQEEERKQAGNRSVERAQNAREAAIAKSVQTTKEANQAKQVANAAKQQEAERRMSGSTKRENALRDDKYISELLNKELGLPSSSVSINDKSVMEMRNAYAKVYQKIKNDSKIAPSTKDEFKKILDYLTEEYEKTRDKNTKTWDDVDRETTANERKRTRVW